MTELQRINKNKQIASRDMCMFVVLNTASLQLIPTSVIALRSANGALNPTDVIPYILIASIIFYAWGEPKYLAIMLLTIIINYFGALAINKYDKYCY